MFPPFWISLCLFSCLYLHIFLLVRFSNNNVCLLGSSYIWNEHWVSDIMTREGVRYANHNQRLMHKDKELTWGLTCKCICPLWVGGLCLVSTRTRFCNIRCLFSRFQIFILMSWMFFGVLPISKAMNSAVERGGFAGQCGHVGRVVPGQWNTRYYCGTWQWSTFYYWWGSKMNVERF